MKLRSLRLNMSAVGRTSNSKTLEALAAGTINKRDDSGNTTDTVDYTYVDCAANRGDTLRVKFPAELKDKIADLRDQLEDDVIINISFEKLRLLPYALRANDGSVLSGVSAKADDFKIVSTTADEIDPDDIVM